MITAAITGISHYLPDYVLTNDEIATMVDTNDEWITTRTGIKTRHILRDQPGGSSQLAIPAVKDVLEKTGTAPEEVECLICATSMPDYIFPSTACVIADKLNIRNAMCYDVLSACTGFLYCLQQAQAFIKAGMYKKIIICSAENLTSFVNYKDRTTCALFGDGGAAALIEPSEEGYGVQIAKIHADGYGHEHLIRRGGASANVPTHEMVDEGLHYILQDGKFVFKQAVTFMTSAVSEVMEEGNLSMDDIDWICTHQANKRIIDAVRDHCQAPEEKIICNIDHVGNTSSASIPIALHEAALEGKLKKGDRLMLAAFGSGFTWGAIYLTWGDCKI